MSDNGAHEVDTASRLERLELDHAAVLRDLTTLIDSDAMILRNLIAVTERLGGIEARLDILISRTRG